MTKFAFYGRVSTEDQQDPASSRGWQLTRARQLIEPHGGVIVAEFFDIGQSRSLPWKRRPEAARLLAELANPGRGWDAVVIGEPARAFYGGQFGLTFPVLTHHGVELWVPEVGGRVDPGSDAHELVMALYGGMSKGERNRIKVRVRSAMSAQATEGRFLGGRPPYGYRLVDAGPHPNPGKAAAGLRQRRLEPDPATAPIVLRIFDEYIGGAGLYAIAEGLTRDGVPSPSAADPERNRHRTGIAWSKSAVRAILANPRYTGRQVWNRQRRDEVLVDVEDVALGETSKLRWNDPSEWVWSAEVAHEPIIEPETFARAREQAAAGKHRPKVLTSRRKRPYVLRGLIACGICGRRMQGSWNHDRAHYRCKLMAEYAAANLIDHPKTVYVREESIVPPLDDWLASAFDPKRADATIEAMLAVQGPADADQAAAEAARRKLADCDDRLRKHRAALEAGADPVIVTEWMREVQGERLAAERALAAAQPAPALTADDLRAMLRGMGGIRRALRSADPERKGALYRELGLHLIYDPGRNVVTAEAMPAADDKVMTSAAGRRVNGSPAAAGPGSPCTKVRVGGGT